MSPTVNEIPKRKRSMSFDHRLFVSAAVVIPKSKESVEDSSVGRKAFASRSSNEQQQMENIQRFLQQHHITWSIESRQHSLFVQIPEEFGEGSKDK